LGSGSGLKLSNRNVEFAAGDGTQNSILSLFQNDFRYCLWSYKIWFRGPNFATVSALLLLQMQLLTFNYIRLGHADVMVTGGSSCSNNSW
jgi:3-oxoacyl-[acyl-carrier-protein] synthase II